MVADYPQRSASGCGVVLCIARTLMMASPNLNLSGQLVCGLWQLGPNVLFANDDLPAAYCVDLQAYAWKVFNTATGARYLKHCTLSWAFRALCCGLASFSLGN